MKNKKILFLSLLILAIGFAAVSTTLFINGTATYSTNKDDFNVIFTNAEASEENKTQSKTNEHATAVIESDEKNITFNTQDLAVVGEWARVDYEITNYSRNYDANVTVSWELDDENDADFVADYLEIDTVQNWTGNIGAGTRETGYVIVSVKKAYLGSGDLNDPKEVGFKVTYKADAVSRETLGDVLLPAKAEISVTAKDKNSNDLNASAYVINGTKKDELLDSLEETDLIDYKDQVVALIEVESDTFEDFAVTTFDVSSIAEEGDYVTILHFDETTNKWEYIGTVKVDENGKVTANFRSYSPVAFVVEKANGDLENTITYIDKGSYKLSKKPGNTSENPQKGDTVKIGEEKFYVYSYSNNKVKALAYYALNTGNYTVDGPLNIQTSKTHFLHPDYDRYKCYVKFADSSGWAANTNIDVHLYPGLVNTALYDSTNGYENYLKNTLNFNCTVKLLTRFEIETLTNATNRLRTNYKITELASNYPGNEFLAGVSYWLGTSDEYTANNVLAVSYGTDLSAITYGYNYAYFGVRPVIEFTT